MPFEIVRNDITKMDVDAIVNAANNSLLGGGGVDGAIHRAAGPRLLEECRTLNGCETGQAKLTRGYDLPCKYVIHTVGPIWQGGGSGERALLADCYRNSLMLAKEYRCESVAFPLISSGAYGYPQAEALKVAVDEINAFLEESDMLVYLVVFTRDTVRLEGGLFREIMAHIDETYVDGDADAHRGPVNAATGGRDGTFSELLIRRIREKGVSEAACCRRANVDRRLFNKIKNNPDYLPDKRAALAFAVALELSTDETRALLGKAGYALSHGNKADVVVEYCIGRGVYDLTDINLALFKLGLQTLGY